MKNHLPDDYSGLLEDLKAEIRRARLRAFSAVNAELLQLYWKLGKGIVSQQENAVWGAKIISNLADDLRKEFPDMKGLSPRNLLYMKQYAVLYELNQITQPPVAQLPWAHHVILMDKVKHSEERLFYVTKSIEHGWSRDMLSLQVKGGLFQRQGKAITNFEHRLPSPQSDLAQQFTKDPYLFDFLVNSYESVPPIGAKVYHPN